MFGCIPYFLRLRKVHPGLNELECFICYENVKDHSSVVLDCNHRVHLPCVVKWWLSQAERGLVCPMCRQKSYRCFMEVQNTAAREPVGYYRHDGPETSVHMMRKEGLPLPVSDNTFFVEVKEPIAKDLVLIGVAIQFEKYRADEGVKGSQDGSVQT